MLGSLSLLFNICVNDMNDTLRSSRGIVTMMIQCYSKVITKAAHAKAAKVTSEFEELSTYITSDKLNLNADNTEFLILC